MDVNNISNEIWLIRHGESVSNANLKTIHPARTPLTETGLQQSRSMASYIDTAPDRIIVSSYTRSMQTAQFCIEKHKNAKLETWPVHEFTYLDNKAYRNTTASERRGPINDYWEQADPQMKNKGAESFEEFFFRAQSVILKLRELKGFTVMISHGHTIRMIWWLLISGLPKPTREVMSSYALLRRGFYIPNCSILKVRFFKNGEVWMSNLFYDFLPPELRILVKDQSL